MLVQVDNAVYKVPCDFSKHSPGQTNEINFPARRFVQKLGVAVLHYPLASNACETFCVLTTQQHFLGGPFRPTLVNLTPWLASLFSM